MQSLSRAQVVNSSERNLSDQPSKLGNGALADRQDGRHEDNAVMGCPQMRPGHQISKSSQQQPSSGQINEDLSTDRDQEKGSSHGLSGNTEVCNPPLD